MCTWIEEEAEDPREKWEETIVDCGWSLCVDVEGWSCISCPECRWNGLRTLKIV